MGWEATIQHLGQDKRNQTHSPWALADPSHPCHPVREEEWMGQKERASHLHLKSVMRGTKLNSRRNIGVVVGVVGTATSMSLWSPWGPQCPR